MIANSPEKIANSEPARVDGGAKVEDLRGLPSIEARWRSGDVEDCKASPNHGKTAKVRSFTPLSASPDINDLQNDCELSCPFLTGLDHLEYIIARGFSQRADGWPVGPELVGWRAWCCTAPTVQLIELRVPRRARSFVVLTLFPFLRIDRRYPPSPAMTLHRARRYAFARLRALAADGTVSLGRSPGIELCRGGHHIGLEVML